MAILYLIFGIGMTVALISVALFVVFDRAAARRRQTVFGGRIVKTHATPLQINPGLLLSKLGQNDPAQRSLDTMVLRPTWGIKLFGLFILCALGFVMLGPGGAPFRQDLISMAVSLAILGYLLAFALLYEVRYDSDGITAPGMFFQPQHYPWSDFVAVTMVDQVHYKFVFLKGSLKIKKFLVGMDTLLTFTTDVQEMTKRL